MITRIVLIVFMFCVAAVSQMTVVVGDFKNQAEAYFLDSWERNVPEFLKSELGKSQKITIIERGELPAVLQEQALSMTGLIDSSTAQKVGDLLGAQFIVSGTISQSGGQTRIDARIIRVATGEVRSEKVQARDTDHLLEMCEVLGQNLVYLLTGEGKRLEKMEVNRFPTLYYLGATVGFGIATAVAGSAYNRQLDKYQAATELDKFDDAYDSAR